MKKESTFLFGAFLFFLAFSFPAVDAQRSEGDITEMLAAFDDPAAAQGLLSVTFAEAFTKDQALDILDGHRLRIYPQRDCTTTKDPVTNKDKKTCTVTDAWDDKTKTALVIVADGKEKDISRELLIDEVSITDIQPSYTDGRKAVVKPTTKGTPDKEEETTGASNDDNAELSTGWLERIATKIIGWFKNIF